MRASARPLGRIDGRRHLPLLLAAVRRLELPFGERLLSVMDVLCLRSSVICELPSDRLGRLCEVEALRLERGEYRRPVDKLEGLQALYPDDSRFRSSLAAKAPDTRF